MCLLFAQSEAEQECSSLANFKSTGNSNLEVSSDVKKEGFVRRSSSDMADQLKGLRTWSSQHSTLEPSHDSTSLLVQFGQNNFLNVCDVIKINFFNFGHASFSV